MDGYEWLVVIVGGILLYKCCVLLLRRYTGFGKEEYKRMRSIERDDFWKGERAADLEIINQFRDADVNRSVDEFQRFCRFRDEESKQKFSRQFYTGIWLGALPIALYLFCNPPEPMFIASSDAVIDKLTSFIGDYLVVLVGLTLTVVFANNIQDRFKCRRTQGYALLITGFIVCCFIAASI